MFLEEGLQLVLAYEEHWKLLWSCLELDNFFKRIAMITFGTYSSCVTTYICLEQFTSYRKEHKQSTVIMREYLALLLPREATVLVLPCTWMRYLVRLLLFRDYYFLMMILKRVNTNGPLQVRWSLVRLYVSMCWSSNETRRFNFTSFWNREEM